MPLVSLLPFPCSTASSATTVDPTVDPKDQEALSPADGAPSAPVEAVVGAADILAVARVGLQRRTDARSLLG